MLNRLTADDFFTGLFAALKLKGCTTINIRNERFDKVIESVFHKLKEIADQRNLDIRFRIRLHPIHGDSSTLRDSITNAAQRDLISLDNPEYQDIRIKIGNEEAQTILDKIPGGIELFQYLSAEFLENSDCHQMQAI